VPLPLLQAIAELPGAALHGGLAQLQAAEFLYEMRLFPEHTYTFKHALMHEVAYSSVLQEQRRRLHTRIVTTLEALAGDRCAEQIERLAYHALRGEIWDKAVVYGRQAGEKTMARSAHREAVEYFEQALRSLSLGEAQVLADHLEEVDALAERTLSFAREHHARGEQAYALHLRGEVAAHRAPLDVHQAAAHYRQALTLAEELGMRPLQAHCHRGLGTLYATTGQREQARVELSTAMEMYRVMGMTFWLLQAKTMLAQVEGR